MNEKQVQKIACDISNKTLWRYDDLVRQNDVHIVVPDGIETIDNETFAGHRYKSITIPESVMRICRYAFATCDVPEIYFKSNNIKISSVAFENAKIQRIYAPTYKPFPGEWKMVVIRTFLEKCANDLGLVEEDNDYKKYIKRNYRKMLAEDPEYLHLFIYIVYANILLPEEIDNYIYNSNVVEIRSLLLEYKKRIVSPELDNQLQKRKEELLLGAPITLEEAKKDWKIKKQKDGTYAIIKYKGFDAEITIPAKIGNIKVTRVDDNAFAGCLQAVSIIISSGITHIGWKAFSECSNLESVILPGSIKVIEKSAFEYCYKLKEIQIPLKVKSIKSETFYNCKQLASVKIEGAISEIGDSAFYGCYNLSIINLPDSLKRISAFAFDGCAGLNVNLSNGVVGIGTCAFSWSAIIRAPIGSYAEKFAKGNGIRFIAEQKEE